MKSSVRFISGFLMLVLGWVPALPAQVIPGRWQKVELLIAGTEIRLETDYGETLDCYFFSASQETLLVVEAVSKEQRRISKTSVKRITAKDYDDRLKNGALFGTIAGAAAGILVTTATHGARERNSAPDRALGAALFGLVGMGLGVLIDYKNRGREILYEAPVR